MKIEKLESTFEIYTPGTEEETDLFHLKLHLHMAKINELIDEFNSSRESDLFDMLVSLRNRITIDQNKQMEDETNRSEQMARFIDRLDKLENEQTIGNQYLEWHNYATGKIQWIPKKEEKEPEILPCPWCKIKPSVVINPCFYVLCENSFCPVQPEMKESCLSKQEAIDAWNTRAEHKDD